MTCVMLAVALPLMPARGAGSNWVTQASGTTTHLASISFVDSFVGHAVGSGGTILATVDGGEVWTTQFACVASAPCVGGSSPDDQSSGSPDRIITNLKAVDFSDASNGHVVGESGTILGTVDGGRSWRRENSGTVANLAAVSFPSPEQGYAVGTIGSSTATLGVILATDDGGLTWREQFVCTTESAACSAASPDRIKGPFKDLTFTDSQHGHIVGGGGTILATDDGGSRWYRQISTTGEVLTGVAFVDASRGFAVGGQDEGLVLATTDGGLSWSAQPIPTGGTNERLHAVAFRDAANGIAVGYARTIIVTSDGGATWSREDAGAVTELSDVSLPPGGRSHAAGLSGTIIVRASTESRPPSAPLRVSAVAGNRSVRVSWQPPAFDGGSPVQRYVLTAQPGATTATIAGDQVSAVIAGLTNGTTYELSVVAVNAIGAGPPGKAPGKLTPGIAWRSGTPTSGPRPAGTATVLAGGACATAAPPPHCGRVLLAGGGMASGEVYDPNSGASTPTGRMNRPRAGHTATLLADGRVLVAGGSDDDRDDVILDSSEIYDPATNIWSTSGRLTTARSRHTAVALQDGRVLVVGGTSPSPAGTPIVLASAEIYDPARSAWAATATPMGSPRLGHTAVVLTDGTVLVAGGLPRHQVGVQATSDAPTGSTELYQPLADAWVPTASMSVPRHGHSATLLADGDVLVVGGRPRLAVDVSAGRQSLGSTERYDATTRSWMPEAEANEGRFRHAAALIAGPRCRNASPEPWCGRVVVTGGTDNGSRSVEMFEPGDAMVSAGDSGAVPSGRWVPSPDTRGSGNGQLLLLGDGALLLLGALAEQSANAPVEVYDPASVELQWPPSVTSVYPRYLHPNGGTKVVIRGLGLDGATQVRFGDRVVTDIDTGFPGQISVVAPPHQPGLVRLGVVTPDGSSEDHAHSTLRYVSGEGSWSSAQDDPFARRDHATTVLDDRRLLVTGGHNAIAGQSVLSSAEIFDPVSGKWSSAGSMTEARVNHTSTRLRNGTVLVTGGDRSATAELYRPSSNDWVTVPPMSSVRSMHAAVLLSDGRVLVIGGQGAPEPTGQSVAAGTETVEIYNPSTATWAPAAPLGQPRFSHTATLLEGGSVLVAGGSGPPFSARASAEVYLPGSDRWVATANPMNTARSFHTATRLATGRVLIVGGAGVPDVFDPSTNGFVDGAPPLGSFGFDHSATLLPSGNVLVVGGCCATWQGHSPATAQLFDPATGTWRAASDLPTGRSSHRADLVAGGRVVVTGGTADSNTPIASVQIFDALTSVSVVTGVHPMVGPTPGGTLVTIRGDNLSGARSVMFGAQPGTDLHVLSSREVSVKSPPSAQGTVDVRVESNGTTSAAVAEASFTYGAGRWVPAAAMPPNQDSTDGARLLHTATLLGGPACAAAVPSNCGQVLVAGGARYAAPAPVSVQPVISSAQLYDPETAAWSRVKPMNVARFGHTESLLESGEVLAAGGQDGTGFALASAEVFDPRTGAWRQAAPMLAPRLSHTATVLDDGRVLVVGGAPSEYNRERALAAAEIYDPRTDRWTPAGVLGEARASHTATKLSDGAVLVAGGATGAAGVQIADALTSAELYDPFTSQFRATGSLAVARLSHTATRLGDGRVLAVGGNGGGLPTPSVESYDPAAGRWTAVAGLVEPHTGHRASLLADGSVLISGGGPTFPGDSGTPTDGAEVFRPDVGTWALTDGLRVGRGAHTATMLDGPECRQPAAAPRHCGRVLVAGGSDVDSFQSPLGSTALYVPAPSVVAVTPDTGPTGGGTTVTITGAGVGGLSQVEFGSSRVPDEDVSVLSPSTLRIKTPRHLGGEVVRVAVVNEGGTSATIVARRGDRFSYVAGPGTIDDLGAVATGATSIDLGFTAPHDGAGEDRATSYVVKLSTAPITTPQSFDTATSLCGGICVVAPGLRVRLAVTDLEPATTYHFSARPLNALGQQGDISNPASAKTATVTAAARCPSAPVGRSDHVLYPAGYSLVGLPDGTATMAQSPLYGWLDQGAGGSYTAAPAAQPTTGGHGYWAWFACPSEVSLPSPVVSGPVAASLPLGAYHASMVGNPSVGPASVRGHDFAARWDPNANGGAGAYRLSNYREEQYLGAGEGIWTFSYVRTEIAIEAAG